MESTEITAVEPPSDNTNLAWNKKGIWSLYEIAIPINFTRSIHTLFERLAVGNDAHVLDVGCGSGLSVRENLRWLQGGGRLTGADPDPAGLARTDERARKLGVGERVQTVALRAEELAKLGEAKFDGAFAHFSIYPIPTDAGRRAAVRSVYGVLRPGSRFAMAVPAEDYNRFDLVRDARELEAKRTDVGAFTRMWRSYVNYGLLKGMNKILDERLDKDIMHRYTREELLDHMQSAGFAEVEVEHLPGFNAYHAVGTRG